MTTDTSDAALVAGHLAGDPSALAGIYDRFADSLHDTAAAMLNDRNEAADVLHDVILIAAERLGQLRDPDRLKPWLFAILRNEVYRRTKKRRRTIATDFSGSDDGYDMADERLEPSADPAEWTADDAAGDDLAELVRNAARGLDERDQLVLELSVRQGLGGQDLADALGVSTNQSYTLVHRMRERVERSLTAFVVAKAGRNDCDDLDQLLAKWDGEFTVLVRKRVARHVDACKVCDTRRSKVAPLAMFSSAPVYAAPVDLRDRILRAALAKGPPPPTPYSFTATDGFPQVVRVARRVAAWVAPAAAASLILVAAGLGVAFADRGDDSVLLDEAFVSVTTDPAGANSTTAAPSVVAPSNSSGATNDSVRSIATTTTTPSSTTTTTDSLPTVTTSVPTTAPTSAPTVATTPPAAPPVAPQPTTPADNPPPADPPVNPPADPPDAPPAAPQAPAPAPPLPDPPTPEVTAPPTPAPTPGRLSVTESSISLGATAASGTIRLENLGDLPVTYSVSGDTGLFSVSPQMGTLDGGASASITASLDRSNLAEGRAPAARLTVSGGDGSSFAVSLSAQVERPPVFSGASASGFCSPTSGGISGSTNVSDESGVSVSFFATGPSGQSLSVRMSQDGVTWFGAVDSPFAGPNFDDPSPVNGTWSWSMTATDTRGNFATTGGSTTVAC